MRIFFTHLKPHYSLPSSFKHVLKVLQMFCFFKGTLFFLGWCSVNEDNIPIKSINWSKLRNAKLLAVRMGAYLTDIDLFLWVTCKQSTHCHYIRDRLNTVFVQYFIEMCKSYRKY